MSRLGMLNGRVVFYTILMPRDTCLMYPVDLGPIIFGIRRRIDSVYLIHMFDTLSVVA